MTASKTFKFAGSTIAVLTGFDADSPSLSISGITKANPGVIAFSGAHGLVNDGEVLKLSNVGGMIELEGEVVIVEFVDSTHLRMVDKDTTDYGAYTSGGKADVARFSNFCELTGYNRNGGSSPEIDTTSLCSESAEFEIGLPNFGTTQLDYKFAPRTAIQEAIADFYSGANKGNKMAVRIDLPKQGGRMVQLGFIQQTSEQAQVNGIWTGSMTLRNTGPRADYDAQ
jgi:hypothetical protein